MCSSASDAFRATAPPRRRERGITRVPDMRLRHAAARLDPDRRAVVVMRFWLNVGSNEIAQTLAVPPGTVHVRPSRALDDLRREIGDSDE